MAETNQLLINYYKKEEIKKVKKMMEENLNWEKFQKVLIWNGLAKKKF